MKTKQIIKALRSDGDPTRYLATEAANRLEMLSVEQKKLHSKLATRKAERDAAMADIAKCCKTCAFSMVNNGIGKLCVYGNCCGDEHSQWKWRGAKDTNVGSKSTKEMMTNG